MVIVRSSWGCLFYKFMKMQLLVINFILLKLPPRCALPFSSSIVAAGRQWRWRQDSYELDHSYVPRIWRIPWRHLVRFGVPLFVVTEFRYGKSRKTFRSELPVLIYQINIDLNIYEITISCNLNCSTSSSDRVWVLVPVYSVVIKLFGNPVPAKKVFCRIVAEQADRHKGRMWNGLYKFTLLLN